MTSKPILTLSALALGAALVAAPVVAVAEGGWMQGRGGMSGQDMGHGQRRMAGDGMDHAHGEGRGQGRGGAAMGAGPMAGPAFDFAAIDADGDGRLTQEELSAHRAAEVAAMDADGDGFITAEEMAAHAEAQMRARMTERAAARLQRLDADGDGRVAVGELPQAGLGAQMFAAIDADGDGAITEEEIASAQAGLARMGGRQGGGMDGAGSRHGMRGFN